MAPEPLPSQQVSARDTARGGENPIHDDAAARRLGFGGGLVPGVTVYAYLTRALVDGLGDAWLERGTAAVRFVKPVYEGDQALVSGEITRRDAEGLEAAATLSAGDGPCGVVTATVPARAPSPVEAARYPWAPLPAERPAVTRERLAVDTTLGTPETLYDEARAEAYCTLVDDPRDGYRGAGAWVHPAFFLEQANRALDRNVRLGPWIHVASRVRHLGGARVGEVLQTRGRVRARWEQKGRDWVELDLLVVAGPGARPVAHVLHSAIWRLAAVPA